MLSVRPTLRIFATTDGRQSAKINPA